jgi:hypothetical protein
VESRLSSLQKDLLDGFFRRQQSFFLTGGAALAGYHLGHRDTEDLDLFTRSADMVEAVSWLRRTVEDLGAEMEPLRTSPDHRRFLVRKAEEGVVVDLVYDHTLPGEQPLLHGIVLVDTPAEILANKLCALLSRAEIRDLVDVMALEQAGEDLNAALALAMQKDAGLTPAQLAWLLAEMNLGDDADIPGDVTLAELRSYLASLRVRLARQAFPQT